MSDFDLSAEQKKVFKILEDSKNNFIVVGKAGTGKSTLMRYFIEHTKKKTIVAAPTGVAAINIGGNTLHSAFGVKPGFADVENEAEVKRIYSKKREVLCKADVVLIDEISMVRADMMDMIDKKLKFVRGCQLPFGGVQVICFGDLYQLAPVLNGPESSKVKARYKSEYFFGAPCIEGNFEKIELDHIFRQDDEKFIKILNEIRSGKVSQESLDILNERYISDIDPYDDTLILTTNNAKADRLNSSKMQEIYSDPVTYHAIDKDFANNKYPVPEEIVLKVGAKVMVLKNIYNNNDELELVNGDIGIVTDAENNNVEIEVDNKRFWIKPETWEDTELYYDKDADKFVRKVIAAYTQIPLRVAYAVTIHKAQGQTYDNVRIDFDYGTFATGQAYVALSRCSTLDGIILSRPIYQNDIMVDTRVTEFLDNLPKITI